MNPDSGSRRRAGGAGELHLRVQHQQRRHAVGGGRGIAQVAADRAARLHLPPAHLPRRLLEGAKPGGRARVAQLGPVVQAPIRQPSPSRAMPRSAGHGGQVEQGAVGHARPRRRLWRGRA
jgi:hypothetical protein